LKTYATFREIQNDLQHGTLSCRDLVLHYLHNIREKSRLNAFLSVYEEEALTRATVIDTKIKEGKAGKLAGMVVGLKE
jgi:aspartyl-tRNA(Asn)/glutamyl-tRNA(Gln) amidotransferase subunit A